MIEMKNFRVFVPGREDALLGFTGENGARRLTIRTDDPEGWAYKLELEFEDGQKNILDLTAGDGELYVDLERAHLARDGFVRAQVRAIRGEQVAKSNLFDLFVCRSIEATEAFEMLEPSEFEQLEANLTVLKAETYGYMKQAQAAGAVAAHPPEIRDGNWWVWSEAAGGYTDSGLSARGAPGPQGEKGETGAAGPQGEKGDAGPQGEKGETGDTGPQGEKGETGEGFAVLDSYATLEALQAAVLDPAPGDAYGVGAAAPYDIYIYGLTSGWVNHGKLQGAKGDKGDPGEQGLPGEKGDKGDPGEKGDPGADGAQGPKGDKGDTGAQGLQGEKGEKGDTGAPGASAYAQAQAAGYTGTEAEFYAALIAIGSKADADHTHTPSDVTVSAAADYTAVRVRGICLAQDSAPGDLPNGCIAGVYTVS